MIVTTIAQYRFSPGCGCCARGRTKDSSRRLCAKHEGMFQDVGRRSGSAGGDRSFWRCLVGGHVESPGCMKVVGDKDDPATVIELAELVPQVQRNDMGMPLASSTSRQSGTTILSDVEGVNPVRKECDKLA